MGEPDEYYCLDCRAHIKEDCECDYHQTNNHDENDEDEEKEKPRERDKGGFLGCGFKYVPGDPFW